jgi:hypothetical protein
MSEKVLSGWAGSAYCGAGQTYGATVRVAQEESVIVSVKTNITRSDKGINAISGLGASYAISMVVPPDGFTMVNTKHFSSLFKSLLIRMFFRL